MAALSGKKVLVTGGFGYIGKHVVLEFIKRGAEVEIWDIKNPFKKTGVLVPQNKIDGILDWCPPGQIAFNLLDIHDNFEQIDYYRDNKHFDIVVNLAAVSNVPDCELNPRRAYAVNVNGALRMIRCAESWNALFIQADSAMSPFASSAGVYAKSKRDAKELVAYSRDELQCPSICLTLYNVAGAHQNGQIGEDHIPETHFIPNIILAQLRHETFKLDRNPNVKRDFIHVMDVADAFVHASELHLKGELPYRDYEVGRGKEVPLKQIVTSSRLFGWDYPVEEYDSGRFEPCDDGSKFAANPANFLPGWEPAPWRGVGDMLVDQYTYMSHRLPQ